MDMETRQGLLGWVIIAVGFGTVYTLIKYPTQFLKGLAILGMVGLILVTLLAAREERKIQSFRENEYYTRYLEATDLADYLSTHPDYKMDEFINPWLQQWYRPNRSL